VAKCEAVPGLFGHVGVLRGGRKCLNRGAVVAVDRVKDQMVGKPLHGFRVPGFILVGGCPVREDLGPDRGVVVVSFADRVAVGVLEDSSGERGPVAVRRRILQDVAGVLLGH